MSDPSPKILVTGASGFIGAHLCRALLKAGHRVVGVCRSHPEALPEGVEPSQTDLADPDAVQALLRSERPEIVYHLASHVAGSRDRALVQPTFEANLASTVYLLDAAAAQGCGRFVLTGSLEEPENVQAPPSSPYAAAKAAATAYARMFHALYDFPVVIARLFMVYGPDQKDERKLVPYVINSLLAGQTPRMSSGTRLVDWIYVQDVVDGLIRLGKAQGVEGATIDLGSGELQTVRYVAERIAHLIGPEAALHFDSSADRAMEQVRVADTKESAKRIGWRPLYTLDTGLEATIAWHRQRAAPAGAS